MAAAIRVEFCSGRLNCIRTLTLTQEQQLVADLQAEHADALRLVQLANDEAIAAVEAQAEEARLELDAIKQQASETGVTQEEAMASTESECRRLYASLKAAEQVAEEHRKDAVEQRVCDEPSP